MPRASNHCAFYVTRSNNGLAHLYKGATLWILCCHTCSFLKNPFPGFHCPELDVWREFLEINRRLSRGGGGGAGILLVLLGDARNVRILQVMRVGVLGHTGQGGSEPGIYIYLFVKFEHP